MKCSNCGSELKEGAKFCVKCGTPVTAAAQPAGDALGAARDRVEANSGTQGAAGAWEKEIQIGSLPAIRLNKTTVIAAAAAVVVVIGIIIGVSVHGSNKKAEELAAQEAAAQAEAEAKAEAEAAEQERLAAEAEAAEQERLAAEAAAQAEAEAAAEAEAQQNRYSEGLHTYATVIEGCTWADAYRACQEAGGHLLTLETDEEYDYVVSFFNGSESGYYYIGGSCVNNEYYWISPDGLNDLTHPLSGRYEWMAGEPSFSSESGVEDKMAMFYRSSEERWVWNDVPSDVLAVVPAYSGKMGYIIEFE